MTLFITLPILLFSILFTSGDLAAEPNAVPNFEALRRVWILSLQARNLDASMTLYGPGAIFYNPDGTHISGEGLRKLFDTVFRAFQAKITMTPHATEFSGDLAYESGSYLETITEAATGQRKRVAGDYLTVYRRTSAGKWLIAQQIWTEAPSK